MKIAVVGLGAVGGLIAARLAAAGREVSALTRGATLAAVLWCGSLREANYATRQRWLSLARSIGAA